MRRNILFLTLLLIMTACRQNPFLQEWDTPYGIPAFDKIELCDYMPAIKEGIKQQDAEIAAIIDNPEEPSFQNVIEALDCSGAVLSRVSNVLFNVSESDYSDALNEIVTEATPMLTAQSDKIYMNADLFAKVKAVYEADQSALTTEQKCLLEKFYKAFVRNGVDLPADKQERLCEINAGIAMLNLNFANNLLAQSNAFKEEFGFSVANYYDRMATTQDRDLRRRIFEAYTTRCNRDDEFDNKKIILDMLALWQEKARLLGYRSPADFILDDKMARNSSTVDTFLKSIMSAAMDRAKVEVMDMQDFMDKDILCGQLPAGSKIEPWDYMYYADRVRKSRFNFDESEVMPYFQMENVRAGVFNTASKLYGLTFEPIQGVALFNPEAEAFKVSDADGSLIGVIITDYYPRDTKRAGAWMSNFAEQYKDADGNNIRPVIVNIGNFNKPTEDKPSLLTIDQVETMFHEFGHALHGLLSQCTYRSLSGTSVKRDFVELPSQINENWAFQSEVLATYAFHYKTGEVIPASLVEKIKAVENFNQGFSTGELCAASILDMMWYELDSVEGIDVNEFEKEACRKMGLIDEIVPRYRSTYFNHIFGSSGYSAGYYGYLWAEVLDKDAFELFLQNGIFDEATAMSFRRNILEKGGSDDPMELYKRFRGAEPDAGALLRARGLN